MLEKLETLEKFSATAAILYWLTLPTSITKRFKPLCQTMNTFQQLLFFSSHLFWAQFVVCSSRVILHLPSFQIINNVIAIGWTELRHVILHWFSKCSVRSPRAPRAICLLIEILTWLILQLSKEAITTYE